MRLIYADNALELFRAEYQNTENLIKQGEKQLDSLAEGYAEAAHIIKHILPTVDAVPVVRCKDCVAFEQKGKYPAGMPEYPDEMPYGYCYHWDYEQGMSPNEVDGNAFCSYGKRKVDENGRT